MLQYDHQISEVHVMDNKEILEKAKKQPKVDERERDLIFKANIVAAIVMSVFVVGFVIATGVLKMRPAYFALMSSMFAYCATLFICRFILCGKKVGMLIGGIAYAVSCVATLVLFIVSIVFGW